MKKDQYGDIVINTVTITKQYCSDCGYELTEVKEEKSYTTMKNALTKEDILINGKPHKVLKKAWKMCPNCFTENKTSDCRWPFI